MRVSSSQLGTVLPKNWPRRVRSALVHAISMSNVVFAVTRSHAENHFNARVRLQAENDRLSREVALLVEELRIKDTRMLRIPPQRRPHYPPVERLAILELRASRAWSLAETADTCLQNDGASASFVDAAAPGAGRGFWYLVRPLSCNQAGTYDSPGRSQGGVRDEEIKGSGVACP